MWPLGARDNATDACEWFFDCKGCGALPKPKPGDCCGYCSFGTVACPPIQHGDACSGPTAT
ncbi:MAG: GDCCVxC domain-containing (seleno)protein [Hoeflea sp.]|uniref:GDCCVxC domain-containing (seleno)protein n=1 Tax=Hoeflea sp. TaxID=1940281 RepID=UPI003EF7CCE9